MRGGEVPDGIVTFNGELTEEQAAEFRERLAAMSDPAFFVREWRRACLRALPRRTRLRLWFTRQVDGIAIWLCDHRQFGTAQALWRITTRRRAG